MGIPSTLPIYARATVWRKTCLSLEGKLRPKYLLGEIERISRYDAACVLNQLCGEAEQADPEAVEVLVTVVDLLTNPTCAWLGQALREEAARGSLPALDRLVRLPLSANPEGEAELLGEKDPRDKAALVPEYTQGRTLTLGERKALARCPTRRMMEKLFSDPHPVVIQLLLDNPKVVERDVIRLASRRPGQAEILMAIAQNPRWAHRKGVRLALVLNSDTPISISVPFLALLDRTELTQVANAPRLPQILRLEARERLVLRPPRKPTG